MTSKNPKIILCFLIILTLVACRSRFAPKFYKIDGEEKKLLNRSDIYFLNQMTLTDPSETGPIKPGNGNVLIIGHADVDPELQEIDAGLITAVGEIEYRIYVDLPPTISIDSVDIVDRSVCRLIGLYNLPEEQRRYACHEGFMVIDTVRSRLTCGYLYGQYVNINNDTLSFEGRFRARLKK
jgi:hypothetical protein